MKQHQQDHHDRHQQQRNGGAEGPIARRRELVLDQVADHHGLAAAEQIGREIGARGRG